MLIIVYVGTIIYLFLRKKEKHAWLIAACLIALLSVTSQEYPDLLDYSNAFNLYNTNPSAITIGLTNNILWQYLNRLFGIIGFNYRGMVLILIFINYYLMNFGIKKIGCNSRLFFAFFLIFPAMIQLIQIRFFTATTIVFLSFIYSLEDSKKSNIKSIVLFIIAFLIHSASIMYILVFFAKQRSVNRYLLIVLVAFLSFLLITNINYFIELATHFLSGGQFNRYISNSTTKSSIKWIIFIIFDWFSCYILSTFIRDRITNGNPQITTEQNNYCMSIAKSCNTAILLLLITTPLLVLDRNYHRYQEFSFMLLYVLVEIMYKQRTVTKNKFLFFKSLFGLVFITMVAFTSFREVMLPVFSFDGFQNIFR